MSSLVPVLGSHSRAVKHGRPSPVYEYAVLYPELPVDISMLMSSLCVHIPALCKWRVSRSMIYDYDKCRDHNCRYRIYFPYHLKYNVLLSVSRFLVFLSTHTYLLFIEICDINKRVQSFSLQMYATCRSTRGRPALSRWTRRHTCYEMNPPSQDNSVGYAPSDDGRGVLSLSMCIFANLINKFSFYKLIFRIRLSNRHVNNIVPSITYFCDDSEWYALFLPILRTMARHMSYADNCKPSHEFRVGKRPCVTCRTIPSIPSALTGELPTCLMITFITMKF